MNQDEFKVSVVIAHYNAGNYIRKALDSLVRQTMNQDDFEVIIVDDKSTKPLDIIQEYESKIKHLRIIVEDQNHGYTMGIKIPNRARLGIVWRTLVICNMTLAPRWWFIRIMARGIAMTAAISNEINDNPMCWPMARTMSSPCVFKMCPMACN